MQLINNTLKDIKDTDNTTVSSVLTSVNQPDDEFRYSEGAGYPAIVRQVTLSQWEQPKVPQNFPILIPGTKKEQCEQSKKVIGATRCNDCHTIELKVEHCESWNCPVCGQRKVRRQAKNIVERLNGFKQVVNTSSNPRHIVVSSDRWLGMTLEQISKSVNNLFARYLRDLAGVYVIHMFRVRGWDDVKSAGTHQRFNSHDNIKQRLRDYRKLNKDSPADFWGMVKADVLGLGDWRDYLYVSPHIHILGWGYLPNSKTLYEETGGANGGFIYKTKEKEGRSFDFYQSDNSFEFTSDILRTLNYLGSHAAIKQIGNKRRSNRIFRPFGFCSVYKLKETMDVDLMKNKEVRLVEDGNKILLEKLCPTCDSRNCVETRLRDIRSYCHAAGFDENYNPVDSEGEIMKELVSHIHMFEWVWYSYHFANYDIREEALRFAQKLPKRRRGNIDGLPAGIVGLEKRIMSLLADYDRWVDRNNNAGLVVEE